MNISNTVGYLDTKITSDMVYDIIGKKLNMEVLENYVKFNPLTNGETGYIYFNYDGEVIPLFFCTLEDKELFENVGCSCISLEKGKHSLKLIGEIVKELGGYIEVDDRKKPTVLIDLN